MPESINVSIYEETNYFKVESDGLRYFTQNLPPEYLINQHGLQKNNIFIDRSHEIISRAAVYPLNGFPIYDIEYSELPNVKLGIITEIHAKDFEYRDIIISTAEIIERFVSQLEYYIEFQKALKRGTTHMDIRETPRGNGLGMKNDIVDLVTIEKFDYRSYIVSGL